MDECPVVGDRRHHAHIEEAGLDAYGHMLLSCLDCGNELSCEGIYSHRPEAPSACAICHQIAPRAAYREEDYDLWLAFYESRTDEERQADWDEMTPAQQQKMDAVLNTLRHFMLHEEKGVLFP